MFSIGDFASHGRVSVRMLRHYDAIGLLRPAHVDPATGYRSYEAAQLARLNRVVALKELGFTLTEVQSIVDDEVGPEELRGMLRLRRTELRSRIDADAGPAPAGRGEAPDHRDGGRHAQRRHPGQGPARGPGRVRRRRWPAGSSRRRSVPSSSPCTTSSASPWTGPAWSRPARPWPGTTTRRTAACWCTPGCRSTAEPGSYDGFEVADLPAVEHAATIVHRGRWTT